MILLYKHANLRRLEGLRRISTYNVLRSSYQRDYRKTLVDLRKLYEKNEPIAMITGHDFLTGKWAEKADMDINLIGDSLAMTSLGYGDTNALYFEEFIYHVRSVERGNKRSFLVADMPSGSFETSEEQAVTNAMNLIKSGGVQGVKIEGGDSYVLKIVSKLTSVGIPVMGHVGLTPQRHNALGGFKAQGSHVEDASRILDECKALQKSGCFAIVLECVPQILAKYITDSISIPTIGIGAGPHCSGQVLVISDILGMGDPSVSHRPRFVKQYADLFSSGVDALKQYKMDLHQHKFPSETEHSFKMKADTLEQLKLKVKNAETD